MKYIKKINLSDEMFSKKEIKKIKISYYKNYIEYYLKEKN